MIIKYRAIDGKEFENQGKCQNYEDLIDAVNKIMSRLKPRPVNDNNNFENGVGCIQHDPLILSATKKELLELMKLYINHHWIQQTIDDDNVHTSYISRLLSDYGIRPFEQAWYRFTCIDRDNIEWGQPFFANHKGGYSKQLK